MTRPDKYNNPFLNKSIFPSVVSLVESSNKFEPIIGTHIKTIIIKRINAHTVFFFVIAAIPPGYVDIILVITIKKMTKNALL